MNGIEYKDYVIDIGYLLPPSLSDFLGPEDEVQIFREITENLDISYLTPCASFSVTLSPPEADEGSGEDAIFSLSTPGSSLCSE